jgi:hypothetical protein
MSTPIAIAAEKGPLRGEEEEGVAGEVGSRREEVPIRSEAFADAWIWDAAINLFETGTNRLALVAKLAKRGYERENLASRSLFE